MNVLARNISHKVVQNSTKFNHHSIRFASILTRHPLGASTGLADDNRGLIFRQLFDYKSFTYTYLLGCASSTEAILIDPVYEQAERDLKLAQELGLNLVFGINTHVHADHVTSTGRLKDLIGSSFRSVLSLASGAEADLHICEGDVIKFGEHELETLETPGHTNGCLTFVLHEHSLALTGDTLLIRGCGRTDFQQGSSERLYDSIHNKIFSLPNHYHLYPGHDYRGFTKSMVDEEKRLNPRLALSKEEFVQFMKELNLAYPKLMDIAVPANIACGKVTQESIMGEEEIFHRIR